MFSVEQRDSVRQRILRLAEEDGRVVAAAEVGSLAVGGGDRWSDIDLTFGITAGAVDGVLHDWTQKLDAEFGSIPLIDLVRESTIYRVFLLSGELQVDLSFTPADEFSTGRATLPTALRGDDRGRTRTVNASRRR